LNNTAFALLVLDLGGTGEGTSEESEGNNNSGETSEHCGLRERFDGMKEGLRWLNWVLRIVRSIHTGFYMCMTAESVTSPLSQLALILKTSEKLQRNQGNAKIDSHFVRFGISQLSSFGNEKSQSGCLEDYSLQRLVRHLT